MKTLVITHVYEIALPYLSDMFKSLQSQTDSDFDLVVFNYGLTRSLSEFGFFGKEVKNELGLGIPDARDWAMKYAKDNDYDLAIFIDADDVMSTDRIEKTKVCYQDYGDTFGFFYTELYLLHAKNEDFFRGSLPRSVDDYSVVERTNCIGLSNFAINVKACERVIERLDVPDYVLAYDWYFSSLLLLNGIRGCLIPTKTYYRIHDLNLAGNTSEPELEVIKRTVSVKSAHYQALKLFLENHADVGKDVFCRIERNAEKYIELQEELKSMTTIDGDILNVHLNTNKSLHWWGAL